MNGLKKYSYILVVALVPVLMSFATDWVVYEAGDSSFSVSFPVKPTEAEQKVPSDAGTVMIKTVTASVGAHEMYMVMSTDFPGGKTVNIHSRQNQETVFRNAIDGGLQRLSGAKLLSEKEMTVQGRPAREFRISFMEGTGIIIARAILTAERMYLVQAVVEKEKEDNEDVSRFFSSFELTAK